MQIKLENAMYKYSPETPFEKTAIDGVSLDVNRGEFVGIIGHTGSGKSTLLQLLNGLLKPTSGKVTINGVDTSEKKVNMRELRAKVGLVFQYPEYQLFEETVFKDIAFAPTNLQLSEHEIKTRVRDSAEIVGLSERELHKSPFELSGGQKRRVAIAGVIAMHPEYLILDEPTAGLDPKGRREILSRISDLHKNTKMAVVLVSHSMEEVASHASNIHVLCNGKIIMSGGAADVFARYKELEKIGLSAPQVTKFMDALCGIKFYSVDEAIKYILGNAKVKHV